MIIQHNISALTAQRNLGMNNAGVNKNLEKLASGFQVNRAGDDAAGLAISEKMRGQIRGLGMAEQNVSHAINLIQTAEGALQESHALLQRMRELAVQSANGTYDTVVDRVALDREFQRLKDEVDRISESTEYNGIKLFEETLQPVGFDVSLVQSSAPSNKYQALNNLHSDFNILSSSYQFGAGNSIEFGYHRFSLDIKINSDGSVSSVSLFKPPSSNFSVAISGNVVRVDQIDNGAFMVFEIAGGIIPGLNYAGGILETYCSVHDDPGGGITGGPSIGMINHITGYEWDMAPVAFSMQIGANGAQDQQSTLQMREMDSAHLGIRAAAVGSQDDANSAITDLEDAINQVSAFRADLGATQNRLEHTLANLGTTRENLTAAESTIRDTDMAKEMMEYTKQSILVQAAQAMLAQAQSLPQGVLTLLR